MMKRLIGVLAVGLFCMAAEAQTSYNLDVPYVAPGSITIDGQLNEADWSLAGTLVFGATGLAGGFDNENNYGMGGNAADNDYPVQTFRLLHDGTGKIYVSMESDDESIQCYTNDPAYWWHKADSDGLGFFTVLYKDSSPAAYAEITLTFWPYLGASGELSEVTPCAGFLANTPRGSVWDWSFLPGNNTPNNPADTDTGYIIEFVIDIADFNYTSTDTDITVGIKTTDKDGLPLDEEWWWQNSWAWVYQWSTGNYAADYTVDHLMLQPASKVDAWMEY